MAYVCMYVCFSLHWIYFNPSFLDTPAPDVGLAPTARSKPTMFYKKGQVKKRYF